MMPVYWRLNILRNARLISTPLVYISNSHSKHCYQLKCTNGFCGLEVMIFQLNEPYSGLLTARAEGGNRHFVKNEPDLDTGRRKWNLSINF